MLYELARPLLFQLAPETAHHFALRALAVWQRALQHQSGAAAVRDPLLAQDLFGLSFPNPLGLAAGFDKNGALPHVWPALGFGFAELGTVTALAQPGNPTPRLFRLPAEQALINRLGFNNDGADAVARALGARLAGGRPPVPLGINLGKSKRDAARARGRRLLREPARAARSRRLRRAQRQLAEHARPARPAGRGAARSAARRRAGREPTPGRRRGHRTAPLAAQGGARPRRRIATRRHRGGACARSRRDHRHQHDDRPQRPARRAPAGRRSRRPERCAAAGPRHRAGAGALPPRRRRGCPSSASAASSAAPTRTKRFAPARRWCRPTPASSTAARPSPTTSCGELRALLVRDGFANVAQRGRRRRMTRSPRSAPGTPSLDRSTG